MRKNVAFALFGSTVLATVFLVVATWRPWDEGAVDRIASSGLVAVLTLILGQLSGMAITVIAQDSSQETRRMELEHESGQREAERRAELKATLREVERERYMEAVRATSTLAPELVKYVRGGQAASKVISDEALARTRVAILAILKDLPDGSDLKVFAETVLKDIAEYYEAKLPVQIAAKAGFLLGSVLGFEAEIGESGLLA